MNKFDITIGGYSLLLLIGGVAGYAVAGSIASLLMSSIFAILLIGSLFYIRFAPALGYRLVNMLLIALMLFFAYRWYTIKFFPSGMLMLITLVVFNYSYFLQPKKKGS